MTSVLSLLNLVLWINESFDLMVDILVVCLVVDVLVVCLVVDVLVVCLVVDVLVICDIPDDVPGGEELLAVVVGDLETELVLHGHNHLNYFIIIKHLQH